VWVVKPCARHKRCPEQKMRDGVGAVQIQKSRLHHHQNKAIRTACLELENLGLLETGKSLGPCRFLASLVNLRNEAISALSLKQREALINLLPHISDFDVKAESVRRQSAKFVCFTLPKKQRLRMIDNSPVR